MLLHDTEKKLCSFLGIIGKFEAPTDYDHPYYERGAESAEALIGKIDTMSFSPPEIKFETLFLVPEHLDVLEAVHHAAEEISLKSPRRLLANAGARQCLVLDHFFAESCLYFGEQVVACEEAGMASPAFAKLSSYYARRVIASASREVSASVPQDSEIGKAARQLARSLAFQAEQPRVFCAAAKALTDQIGYRTSGVVGALSELLPSASRFDSINFKTVFRSFAQG